MYLSSSHSRNYKYITMKAFDIISEANLGTNPKRPTRSGSRPERGHELQKRYVTDRKTGKQYDPDEEFDKLKNSPEFQSQMKRMAQKEGFDYTMKDLGNDYAGFASNHSMKHKMLKRIKPEKHQLYKDKMNNMHEFDDLLKLFKVAQARGDVIEQGVAEGDVVQFPKKHKGDLSDTHDCPKCGGDLQSGKYQGHRVKVCMPCKQVYLPPNSGIDQHGNKITDEGTVQHNTSRLWAQIADYEKRAKATKNDIRKTHYAKMADELRAKLPTSDNVEEQFCDECGGSLAEHGKASRELCKSSKPDADLGASMLSSCKSQGLRARDGNKSHKLGKDAKSRVKVGGHRIKGQKYGGPLPDWS